jgi:hypothetical protein
MRDDLEGFGKEERGRDWYLARDGQQYGPLSDAEMTKFNELGHLRGTDLVWREGFADWRIAREVFDIGRGESAR